MIRIAEKAQAGPGFDDPIGLLGACHERIEGHCATLVRLKAHVRTRGFDSEACQAADRVLAYFAEAGRWHHEDEERNLAPLLGQRADPALLSVLTQLMAQHRDLEAAYAPLAAALTSRDANDLPVEAYVDLMRAHMETENSVLLPAARRLLTAAEVETLGTAMAERRGVKRGAL